MFSSLLPLTPDAAATAAPYMVADEAEMLALPALVGDFAIRADTSSAWQLRYAPATVLTNWEEFPGGPPGGSSINWLGAWNSGTAYVENDAVSSGGSSYLCILAHTNQAPPNATYWGVLASKGDAGADGTDGADGADGAAGIRGGVRYTFSTTTTDSDPGSGNVRFNNATIASVTWIYFDNEDAGAVSQTGWLDAFDDANLSTRRGILTFQAASIATSGAATFLVTGAVVDGTGYRKVPVTYLSGALWADATALAVNFSPAGAAPLLSPTVQSGTSYTLALADAGTMVQFSNTGAIALTVPTNASVAFPIGTQILIQQTGASPGQTTVSGAGGVTVNVRGSRNKTAGQYAIATLIKTGTDTWQLGGDLST